MPDQPPKLAANRKDMLSTHATRPWVRCRYAGSFTLLNVLVVCLIATRYLATDSLPKDTTALVYLGTSWLGHFASLVSLAGLLVLLPLCAIVYSRRLLTALSVTLATVLVLLLISDTIVFGLYRSHINSLMLAMVFGPAAGDIFEFSWVFYATLAATIAAIAGVETVCARAAWAVATTGRAKRLQAVSSALLVVCFFSHNFIYMWADANYNATVTREQRYFPLYFPLTGKRFLEKYGIVEMGEQREQAAVYSRAARAGARTGRLYYPPVSLECPDDGPTPNIVFVVIDSLRPDMLSPEVSPNLHRWSRQHGLVFHDHHSGGVSTGMGIFSLFYGVSSTYWHSFVAAQQGPLLIQELKNRGYSFGIFASAGLSSPELDRTVFKDLDGIRVHSSEGPAWARDRSLTDEFIAFLQNRRQSSKGEQPFFAFLFYDSVHAYSYPPDYPLPFEPSWARVNHLALNSGFDPTPYVNRYRNAAHYVDGLATETLDALRNSGEMDNTIVVLTSDHGEEFNDLGLNYWGHAGNYSRFQTQVPLVTVWPGMQAGQVSRRTSHYDVVPTLLSRALGCTTPAADYSDGLDLFGSQTPSHFIVSANNRSFALIEKDLIAVFYPTGPMDLLDPATYRELESATVSAEALKQSLHATTRLFSPAKAP